MAARSWGIHVESQLLASAIPLSWAFWLSEGVNQMKLVPFDASAITAGVSPEANEPPVGTGVSSRNALWSNPRDPFWITFHVLPDFWTRSRIVGACRFVDTPSP